MHGISKNMVFIKWACSGWKCWWSWSCHSSSESSPTRSRYAVRLVVLQDAEPRHDIVASIREQRVGMCRMSSSAVGLLIAWRPTSFPNVGGRRSKGGVMISVNIRKRSKNLAYIRNKILPRITDFQGQGCLREFFYYFFHIKGVFYLVASFLILFFENEL